MSTIQKIFIAGRKHSGKTTSAQYIANNIPETVELTFAGPLKRACKELFLLSDEQLENQFLKEQIDERWGVSPRQMFQSVGDLFRIHLPTVLPQLKLNHSGKIFTENMYWRITDLETSENKPNMIVISDGRFADELKLVTSMENTLAVKLVRETNNSDSHASEQIDFPCDFTINNNGTVADLQNTWADILKDNMFKKC